MQENSMAEIIKNRLKEKDWRAADLSRYADVPPATISRILNGSEQVSVQNIYKILKSLDLLTDTSNNSNNLNMGAQNRIHNSTIAQYNNTTANANNYLNELEDGFLKLFRKLDIDDKTDLYQQVREKVKNAVTKESLIN